MNYKINSIYIPFAENSNAIDKTSINRVVCNEKEEIPTFTNRVDFMEWANNMLYNHVWGEFIEYISYHHPLALELIGLDEDEIEENEELSRAYKWFEGKDFRNLPLNSLGAQFIIKGKVCNLRNALGFIDASEFVDYLDDKNGVFDWANEDMRDFADSKGMPITDDVKAA